ncbi:V-type ATP synthase subunit I [Thiohalocapsa sp. ML1]|uniref:V-type ATP synthase subunit I n=1 Tax=Thiohalocapsa sp. ML1 TaxID=1431688 RepID=UPI0007322947|nr:V-type ATPase 116kDa subunit family protein [Thiohalocapsa sp. ML1]
MAIERLKRVSLVGSARHKAAVLDRLQALGCAHLLPLAPPSEAPETLPPEHAEDARAALRWLLDEPEKRRQVRAEHGFDIAATVRQVLANKDRLRATLDLRDALAQRARDLAPWGDFRLPPGDALAGQRLWFYELPLRQLSALEGLDLPWQIVHRSTRHAYVVVIAAEEPPADALPVPRVHTGALSLQEVERQLEAAELALEDATAERRALTRWVFMLTKHFARAEDQAVLRHAESQTLDLDGLFAVQGWVGVSQLPAVEALAEEQDLALLLEDPAPADLPPTLLANHEQLGAGEDLVRFYQMPAYSSFDPTRVLFFSFAIFFAMILSDAGYAALLGLGLVLFWRRLGASAAGRRFRVLGGAIAGASFAWGVAVGSYFGFAPAPGSLPARLNLLDLNDFDSMLRLSVGVGVFHVVLANLVRAGNLWPRMQALSPVGWMLVALGGFTLWLGMGAAQAADLAQAVGIVGIGLGLLLVFVASSARPIAGLGSLLLRGLDGLMALTQVTKIFGDTLSYLRLFALGLASASLALTFNDLARQVGAQVPGLGLLLQILLLVIGHSLNLALGLISGVVHGLRLNYIEFYNWALSGEGYPFRPFKKTEMTE